MLAGGLTNKGGNTGGKEEGRVNRGKGSKHCAVCYQGDEREMIIIKPLPSDSWVI